ncbi:MAG: glycosyltransferase family 2 protein [Gammaproteobacteria bacterium]
MPADISDCELSIVMPCLNEAETLAICLAKARGYLKYSGISGEIVVADNGSIDGSQDIACSHGARVVAIYERGYGAALSGGIKAAQGRYVIMGDSDDSYDFSALDAFVAKLREGYELVMGNRFKGGIKQGAMPPLHRYLGNPVLTGVGRLFFGSPVSDFHCGLRGFDKAAIARLDLQTTGMEFASEMVVKATLHGLRIAEVPTTLSPDGRSHPPHLRSWRDGWRHLRFLLIYSPRWLFLYPGFALIALGIGVMLWLVPGPQTVSDVTFDIHTLMYAAAATVLGVQSVVFALLAQVFAVSARLLPANARVARAKQMLTLERGLGLGAVLTLLGLAGSGYAVTTWGSESFGPLVAGAMMRIVIPSVTALIVGVQMIFASFFLSILQVRRK